MFTEYEPPVNKMKPYFIILPEQLSYIVIHDDKYLKQYVYDMERCYEIKKRDIR